MTWETEQRSSPPNSELETRNSELLLGPWTLDLGPWTSFELGTAIVNPETKPTAPRSLFDTIGAVLNGLLTGIRKAPIAAVFVVLAIVLYYRQSHQETPPALDQFEVKGEPSEPKPPPDLPQGTAALVWSCVHQVDTKLSSGLWADVYYGMEASFDGKMVVAKVTEKWQGLSDDKRQTVVKLIVDTWVENGKTLKIFSSDDELQEVVIKQLPDDEPVASWKPTTGVQLSTPQTGA